MHTDLIMVICIYVKYEYFEEKNNLSLTSAGVGSYCRSFSI